MLEITLLGEIVILLDGKPGTRIRGQKEIALLAYLAHTGQTYGREVLADLFWEARSTKQSLSNLRTALSRLRTQVGDQLIVTRSNVSLPPAVHEQTDSVRMQAMLAGTGRERSQTGIDILAQGLALYGGEFMAGFSLARAPRFNDWLLVEQERLRQIAMRGYRQLAVWQEEEGAFNAGVITAQQWVAWDPLDETAQQQLMRLLAFDGRGSEAIRVYEQCRDLLQTELAIPPAPATTALYHAIQDGSLASPEIVPALLHNLPRALTPLFGRKKEIKKLTTYLVNPDYPLISLTGPGGIGKTSLALAAGRQLLIEEQVPFKDGIWFFSFEGIENDTPEKIREEAAALLGPVMGLFFYGESDLWPQLLGQLASKNQLLILDDIEQFFNVASDLIVDLLEAGEDMHILVISQTTLALGASVAFPLAGLQTPTQASPEALNNESVRLFAERAARMPAPFHLEKHLAEVVAICQFVEGMPLGIELAAASLGRLMVDEIMPALTGNLQLLNSSHRDLLPRQRTIQAVFDYTWQLLDPHEQTLLAQISIFRAGFTRQAAESVLYDTTSDLSHLSDHALLSRDETGRFRMHPLLHQSAREKLSAPHMIEIAERVLEQHSLYFAQFMASFADELQCGAGQETLQTILYEQANLRAAWQHAVQAGQWPTIATCLNGSHFFYQRQGFFSEETALIDSAINRLQETPVAEDVLLSGLLSRLLTVRARNNLHAAQFAAGLQTAERACALAIKLQDPGLEGQARLVWAQIHSLQHKHEQALAQFEQVVVLAKRAQNQILEADGWIGLGEQMGWLKDSKSTEESLHTALELCQRVQYKPGEVRALIVLGEFAQRQGAFAQSAAFSRQALQLSRLLGDVAAEAEVLGSLGVGLAALSDMSGSRAAHDEALAIFRRLNMPESEQWILGQLGYTAIQLGDFGTAERDLAEALAIARRLKDEFWQAWVKLRLGELWTEREHAYQALSFITDAYETAKRKDNPRFMAAVLYHWGNALLGQSDWVQAEQKFQRANELWQGSDQTEKGAQSLAGLAYVAHQQERLETAAAHAEQLWQTWQESPEMAERADLKLYWRLGIVWDGLGDSRAKNLWKTAYDLLQQRCELILDENGRKMFLERVPANRAILEAPI